jgi:hypothetical protein
MQQNILTKRTFDLRIQVLVRSNCQLEQSYVLTNHDPGITTLVEYNNYPKKQIQIYLHISLQMK